MSANGSLDTGFDPKANGFVISVAVQGDGKIVLGGTFTTLQPNGAAFATARQYVARVNADGSLDAGFDPKANNYVSTVAAQADGKILFGGDFSAVQPNGATSATLRTGIARVNADGSLDTGFDLHVGGLSDEVLSMAVQADGKILLGGDFSSLQPNGAPSATARRFVARVNADGSLDAGFDPAPNFTVNWVAVQADGKILLGGRFAALWPNGAASPTTRRYFARLNNDAATQTLSAPDASQVLWQRGGGSAEVSMVTFELSIDGGANWTFLGNGTRMGNTSNWQLTGLTLPASGQLRARGRTADGSGLIEQVAVFSFLTSIQQWKLTQLGDANAPDLGDTDFDGLVHLAEYALNLSPTAPSLPPPAERHLYAEGERLRMFFTRDPARNDVTLEVQSADSPAGPWTTVAASTLGGVTTGPGYVGGDDATPGLKTVEVRDTVDISPTTASRYLRVKVTH